MRQEVIVDQQQVDFDENNTLPVALSKGTDELLAIVGTLGTTVDSEASTLALPASKTNDPIMGYVADPSADSTTNQSPHDVIIRVGTEEVFSGKGVIKDVSYNNDQPDGYFLDLYGDADEFFGIVSNSKLTELDVGTIGFSTTTIAASWTNSYDTGYNAVYAPAIYKDRDSTEGLNNHGIDWVSLRPHIYFRTIIDAISNLTGYTFESQFFDTDFFKRHVYLFGVGTQWKKSNTTAEFNQVITSPINPQFISFIPIPVLTYTVQFESRYRLTTTVGSISNAEIQIRIEDSTGAAVATFGPYGTTTSWPQINEIILAPGDQIFVDVRRGSGTGLIDILSHQVQSIDTPVLNSTIELSTCLHREPINDFLRGIQHMFNLAWRVNTLTKTVFVEPRFDYEISGTRYQGFYHANSFTSTDQQPEDWEDLVDKSSYDAEYARPYGDTLTLRFKRGSGDIYDKAERTGADPSSTYLAAELDMVAADEEGETVENPYFEDLILTGNNIPSGYGLPMLNENYEPETGFGDPTYETGPKCGIFYGYYSQFSWWITGESSPRSLRPNVFQRPAGFIAPAFDLGYVGSYNDWVQRDAGATVDTVIPGYYSLFYQQWHYNIRKGYVLKVKLSLSAAQFYRENFTRLKTVKVAGHPHAFILLKIDSYRILEEEADVSLLLHLPNREDATLVVRHNQQSATVDL